MSNAPYPTQDWGAQPPSVYPSAPPSAYPEAPPPYNGAHSPEANHQFTSSRFSDKAVRRGFIRKVYLILTAQLLVTTAIVCIFTFVRPVKRWVTRNSWFYYLSYATFLVTFIALGCCVECRRRFPTNVITLAVFTLALSYMTGTLAAYNNTEAVLIALLMTVALCLAITLFAVQTKIDFTMCSGLIFALTVVVLLTGLASMIVYLAIGRSRVMQAVYAGLVLVLFSILLIYHTQQIVGGRKYDLDPEEYVFGAMQLYVDIVVIFAMLVGLMGASNQ